MTELEALIKQAVAQDLGAYDQIVARYRDMAYSYAYTILRDFHLAEDATQEAFLQAFYDLAALREPQAFPGWLRRIVFKQCDRLTRRKQLRTVSWEDAAEIAVIETDPDQHIADQERHTAVHKAIAALPAREREAILLFYIRDYSQNDIAAFLGVPASTVNSRLQSARRRLKGMVMEMVKQTIKEYQLPETFRVIIKRPSQVKTSAPALIWFRERWVLVWQDGVRGEPWDHPYWFFVSESNDAKNWSEPRQIDLPKQFQHSPKLCVMGDKLWMYTHDYHGGIRIARTQDLQHWEHVALLPLGDIGRGGLFTQGNDLFFTYARWCGIESIGDTVEVITSTDGISWRWLTSPCPSHGTGVTDTTGITLQDKLFVFWREHKYDKKHTGFGTFFSSSADGGLTWTKPVQVAALSIDKESYLLPPLVTPDGRLVVAHDMRGKNYDRSNKGEMLVLISADLGQTWPVHATYPTGQLIDPALAFAPDGTAIIAADAGQETETRPVVVHCRLEQM
jgi:RNA polymerase sigma factor (sigma-70 family)